MLGADQERFTRPSGCVEDTQTAAWNMVSQQTIVSRIVVPLGAAEGLNLDQWDGYPAARRRLVDQLRGVDNPVVRVHRGHQRGRRAGGHRRPRRPLVHGRADARAPSVHRFCVDVPRLLRRPRRGHRGGHAVDPLRRAPATRVRRVRGHARRPHRRLPLRRRSTAGPATGQHVQRTSAGSSTRAIPSHVPAPDLDPPALDLQFGSEEAGSRSLQ